MSRDSTERPRGWGVRGRAPFSMKHTPPFGAESWEEFWFFCVFIPGPLVIFCLGLILCGYFSQGLWHEVGRGLAVGGGGSVVTIWGMVIWFSISDSWTF